MHYDIIPVALPSSDPITLATHDSWAISVASLLQVTLLINVFLSFAHSLTNRPVSMCGKYVPRASTIVPPSTSDGSSSTIARISATSSSLRYISSVLGPRSAGPSPSPLSSIAILSWLVLASNVC